MLVVNEEEIQEAARRILINKIAESQIQAKIQKRQRQQTRLGMYFAILLIFLFGCLMFGGNANAGATGLGIIIIFGILYIIYIVIKLIWNLLSII